MKFSWATEIVPEIEDIQHGIHIDPITSEQLARQSVVEELSTYKLSSSSLVNKFPDIIGASA